MKIIFKGEAARGFRDFLIKQARLDTLPEDVLATPKFAHIELVDEKDEVHMELIVRTNRGEGAVRFKGNTGKKPITELR